MANTGIALHRLGAKTRFVGKVGDDLLGRMVLDSLREHDSSFPQDMVVVAGEATSYSVVLSLPEVDRCFLHCPGVNETFVATDLNLSACHDTRILHFGYPPLMPGVLADNGRGLAAVFAEAQATGALTSLDMAIPAANSTMLPTDWRSWLREVLPYVDVFLPSFDEISRMLAPRQRNEFTGGSRITSGTMTDSSENLSRKTPTELLKACQQLHDLVCPCGQWSLCRLLEQSEQINAQYFYDQDYSPFSCEFIDRACGDELSFCQCNDHRDIQEILSGDQAA